MPVNNINHLNLIFYLLKYVRLLDKNSNFWVAPNSCRVDHVTGLQIYILDPFIVKRIVGNWSQFKQKMKQQKLTQRWVLFTVHTMKHSKKKNVNQVDSRSLRIPGTFHSHRFIFKFSIQFFLRFLYAFGNMFSFDISSIPHNGHMYAL